MSAITAAVFASVLLVVGLSGSVAAASDHTGHNKASADVAALYQLQARLHESISGGGNIEKVVSLWSSDATFTVGDTTYHGKKEIRAFFLQSPGFTHNWVSISPTFKDRFSVRGRTADIYFECHFVDWQADPQVVVTHTTLQGTARKIHGHWFFWHVSVGTNPLTP